MGGNGYDVRITLAEADLAKFSRQSGCVSRHRRPGLRGLRHLLRPVLGFHDPQSLINLWVFRFISVVATACGCGFALFSDIMSYALGIRLVVGQQTLNLLAQVRTLDPQPVPHGAFV